MDTRRVPPAYGNGHLAIFGTEYVRLAAPGAIGEYEEPEPDTADMHRPLRGYLRLGTPLPEKVRLAVEVSDRTLRQI